MLDGANIVCLDVETLRSADDCVHCGLSQNACAWSTVIPAEAHVFAPIGWRYRWIGVDDVAVVSRRGWLTRRTSIVPHRKNQSVSVEQGPLQRRLGVSSVAVHSPDGPVAAGAPHLDRADALAIAAEASRLSRASTSHASMRSGSSS